jgi:hypothetical protein
VKGISGAICEWTVTQFSLTIYESTGAVWDNESFVTYESGFVDYFSMGIDFVFLGCL